MSSAIYGLWADLAPYNSVGKLKNLRVTLEDIEAQKVNLSTLERIKGLIKVSGDLSPLANYLAQAELALPADNPWAITAREARATLVSEFTTHRDLTKVPAMRQVLEKLKKDYVAAYIGLHTKARLGVSEDKAKAGLTRAPRLVALNRLATINMINPGQLTEFQNHMAGLKTCFDLTEGELATRPVCPHCQFRSVNEALGFASAANQLTILDGKLDELLAGWTQTLLENLDDPTVQENFTLLTPANRTQVKAFIKSKTLPDSLPAEFIDALQEAFFGLIPEVVKLADIQAALLAGGSPTAPDELKARFEKFIAERIRGKDARKLRFIVE